MYKETQATKRILALKKRIRAVSGGTAASKTISILLYLIAMAQTDTKSTLTSIVSESFPHLKRGVMRDFLDIMETHKYFKEANWNKTDYIYTFETGSKIEFFSADQPGKVRGPRRDRLFINEANNIPLETFEQLEVRTREFVFLDWNPVREFWYYTEVAQRDDTEHITLTYRDNDALSPEMVKAIEQRKGNTNWWRVYGEGLLGEIEGKIYFNWKTIDEIPHEARLERYGLDFGYTIDPTTVIGVHYYDGGYILDEVLYQRGMSNKQIADNLKNIEEALVVADSAEPKSIDELKEHGVNIIPATKGKDSVRNGIQFVQQQKISITKRSLNLIKEYRNYVWARDRNGIILSPNEPEPGFDHCMDALRYAIVSLINTENPITAIRRELQLERDREERISANKEDYGL